VKAMPDSRKIGIIGGDKRQLVTAACLSADFECAVWGFAAVYGTPDEKYLKNTVRCTDWESAVKCSDAVIMPLPVTRDTGSADVLTLNAPLAFRGEGSAVHLTDICRGLKRGCVILGGMIPASLKRFAAEHGIGAFDYYDSEKLQIKNAVRIAPLGNESEAARAGAYAPEREFVGVSTMSAPDIYFMLFELSDSRTGEKRRAIFYFEATQKMLSICRYYNPSGTVLSQVSR